MANAMTLALLLVESHDDLVWGIVMALLWSGFKREQPYGKCVRLGNSSFLT